MRRQPLPAVAVAVMVALFGCGTDDDVSDADGEPVATASATSAGTDDRHTPEDDETPGHETATPTPDTPGAELIELEIAGGQVEPPLGRVTVDQGATVRIVVTSDQPDELHLHGYDLETEATPDAAGVLEFVADQTGVFELETHETALVLLQLQVE